MQEDFKTIQLPPLEKHFINDAQKVETSSQ